jgi:hypothetical protein
LHFGQSLFRGRLRIGSVALQDAELNLQKRFETAENINKHELFSMVGNYGPAPFYKSRFDIKGLVAYRLKFV